MKKNKVLAVLLIFAMVLCFASCGGGKKEESVTVTFDTDGGSAVESQSIKKGAAVVKPSTPKKDGYIFDKWTLNGSEYEFGSAVNENITLKATWKDPNAEENKPDDNQGNSSEGNKPDDSQNSSSEGNKPDGNQGGSSEENKPDNNQGSEGQQGGESTAPAGKPGISLDADSIVLQYHNNEASYPLHAFTVNFENGANPSSKITWTSSNPEIADVTDSGVVGGTDLGYTMITATTEEGYTAYCHVYVQGIALKVFITGGGGELKSGHKFKLSETYELSLVKQIYTESLTDTIYLTDQCEFIAPTGISFDPQTEYYGILSFDRDYISKGEYQIQFVDSLNNVSSDLIAIVIE